MHEKSSLQDQSLMAFEEHEEKLHKIQQQETVSSCIIAQQHVVSQQWCNLGAVARGVRV